MLSKTRKFCYLLFSNIVRVKKTGESNQHTQTHTNHTHSSTLCLDFSNHLYFHKVYLTFISHHPLNASVYIEKSCSQPRITDNEIRYKLSRLFNPVIFLFFFLFLPSLSPYLDLFPLSIVLLLFTACCYLLLYKLPHCTTH